LKERGVAVRVVSMPSTTQFDRQPRAWREAVLPLALPVVAVEAGSTSGWGQYVGRAGRTVGLDRFGESAPAAALFEHFGITASAVVDAVQQVIRT
jgi:transketolase